MRVRQVIERENGLYLEDLHVGQRFTSETYVMEEGEIKQFAAKFDPQPFHLDAAPARRVSSKVLWRADGILPL